MPDVFTAQKRSEIMSKIRGKDTKAENLVRKWLYAHGFRYRKNYQKLPGKPDVVIPKYKTIVFVHGCFWHNHQGCKYSVIPKTRTSYWEAKFKRNIERDEQNKAILENLGYKVLIVWECELKKNAENRLNMLIDEILERGSEM